MNNNKLTYRALVKDLNNLPLFLSPWWLDAACGEDNWDVCIALNKKGTLEGVLPYRKKKKALMTLLQKPMLTPYLGPWLASFPTGTKTASKGAQVSQMLEKLIEQLPRVFYTTIVCPVSISNVLPFQWRGFSNRTYYTFIISKESNSSDLFDKLRPNIRNKIRKANETFIIKSSDDLNLFYEINAHSFNRKANRVPYSKQYLSSIDKVLKERRQRKIYTAIDKEGRVGAALYIAWDELYSYSLATGIHSDFLSSGAVQLLNWRAIKDALKNKRSFDFCGSMLKGVFEMNAGFGGVLTPYYVLRKGKTPLIDSAINLIKSKT